MRCVDFVITYLTTQKEQRVFSIKQKMPPQDKHKLKTAFCVFRCFQKNKCLRGAQTRTENALFTHIVHGPNKSENQSEIIGNTCISAKTLS